MEPGYKRHIENNFLELLKITKCNVICTSVLRTHGVLEQADIEELNSIPTDMKRAEKLYDIVMTREGSFPHLIEAFEAGTQTGVLAILNRFVKNDDGSPSNEQPGSAPKRRRKVAPIRFDVLPTVLNFTGRVPELSELHQKLQDNNLERRVVISQMTSIVGLGGIGKTELARKYIEEYGEKYYDGNVIWISAQTEDSLRESFCRLASDRLKLYLTKLEIQDKDIKTIVDEVYTFFSGQKVLFVLDNAESTEYLQKFMPLRVLSSLSSLPYILITSRDREWAISAQVLELDEMSEKDAISFVRKSLKMKEEDDCNNESALKLVNNLQRYPLALSQAVCYINQREFSLGSIEKYLEEYEKSGAKKLLKRKIPPALLNSYAETTLTTWSVTTDHIFKNEEYGRCAMQILHLISYFLPEKIPYDVFSKLSDGEDYEDALHILIKYSMVKDQRSEKTISVHRLVQEVTRIELKQSGEEDQTMKTGLQMLSSGIIGNFEENSIPHAISLLKYASILNPEIIAEFKHLPWKIVDVLNIGKRFDESENVGNEMLQLLAKFIPLDDPDLCRLKYQSAVTALTRGQDYEEMLKRNLEILQMLQIKYVENKSAYSTSETLALQSLLVDYLHEFNQYKEALALARKTFAQQKELNGLNHWQTIDALVSVGNSFHQMIFSESRPNPPGAEAMEQLEQIISLLKEAHESNLELIGKDINWTNSINNLMLYLANIGECEFAAKIISDVIERTNNCDCNGDKRYARIVIKCLNILACIKTDEGKLEEALKIYENVHSKYVSLKGQNDGETLSAKLNVILKLMELNKLEDALESCKNVLQSLEKYYPNNLQVIEVQTSMVLILAHMGRLKESRELLNDCEEQSANKFGHDHPIVKGLKSHPFKSRLDSCIKKQDELENSEKVD